MSGALKWLVYFIGGLLLVGVAIGIVALVNLALVTGVWLWALGAVVLLAATCATLAILILDA